MIAIIVIFWFLSGFAGWILYEVGNELGHFDLIEWKDILLGVLCMPLGIFMLIIGLWFFISENEFLRKEVFRK